MGVRGLRGNGRSEYTESWMQWRMSSMLSNPRYVMENLYIFDWESDLLLVTYSGYYYEVEVKLTLSDFKRDFEKTDKHCIMENGYRLRRTRRMVGGEIVEKYVETPRDRPNYFLYAVPSFLADKVRELVPPYAGFATVNQWGTITMEKKPPLLHKTKLDVNLQDKFYFNWRREKEISAELRRAMSDRTDEQPEPGPSYKLF